MLSAGATRTAAAEVPFVRLDYQDPELLEELLGVVRQVAQRGAFTLGAEVEAFERELASYCETELAVGVSSGTTAIELALRALEIGPGDEVIVPANSFIATAEAVSAVGATPLLVDVDPESQLIDADIVAAALTPRVRCVIPVHLFGRTVEMDPIMELAVQAGVYVIEDACQAHGARYRGRRVGCLGDVGCFSFYPTKNLGAWGDGGALVTSLPRVAQRVRLLRSHGERPRYCHRVVGATARLDALQAAVLRRKLPRLDAWNRERRRLASGLRERLAGAEQLEMPAVAAQQADHVYHLFVVRCERREALREHLAACGVASAIHYPTPIHLTDAYAHLDMPAGSLPACETLAQQICSLPLFPGMSEDELDLVCAAAERFAKGKSFLRVDLAG